MQISNTSQATFYAPALVDRNQSARLPVVFDAEVESDLSAIEKKERSDNTTYVVPTPSSQDSQASDLARDFLLSNPSSTEQSQSKSLPPKSIQQYLYVDNLNNETLSSGGQILDEMV